MRGICPSCEKETSIEFVSRDEDIVVRGELILVRVEFFRCAECGTEFRSPRSADDPLDVAYQEYRKRHNLVQPEEIKGFRKQFGLTQQELANLLGWGAVTLSRYENGALQDEAHDTMLKLAMEPENLLELVERKPEALSKEKRTQLTKTLHEFLEGQEFSFEAIYETKFGGYDPSEYSGYRRLNVLKLFSAIVFFCADSAVPKTKLNKLLFYADFKHYKEYTISITGARYAHLPYGPAPDNYQYYIATLYHERKALHIEEYRFDGYTGEYLTARQKPDLSLFSTTELKVLAIVKERFAPMSASHISDLSHREKGYQQTVNGELISYAYALELSF